MHVLQRVPIRQMYWKTQRLSCAMGVSNGSVLKLKYLQHLPTL